VSRRSCWSRWLGTVLSPASWSPAGHRAVMVGPREREREREEGDDRRDRAISGRVRERARALPGHVAGLARSVGLRERSVRGRVRVGRPRGWAEPEEERRSRPEMNFLFFFFKNVNSISFCLFQ
jgi:hypothetical protein